MTYRISTVAEVTGIPRNTLLAWERRYGLVRPTRHENGYRSYTDDDVAIILRLRNAIAAGLRIGEAVELIKKQADSDCTTKAPETPPAGLDGVSGRLLQALLEYRRSEAEEILTELRAIPILSRARQFYFPLLRELWAQISERRVTVAQGQLAVTTVRAHLVSVLVSADNSPRGAPQAATTTFPEDTYELSALAVAVQLAASGFRVSYLGAGLSSAELIDYARKKQPAVVCISCSSAPEEAVLAKYVEELGSSGLCRYVLGEISLGPEAPPGVEFLRHWEALDPEALLAQTKRSQTAAQ